MYVYIKNLPKNHFNVAGGLPQCDTHLTVATALVSTVTLWPGGTCTPSCSSRGRCGATAEKILWKRKRQNENLYLINSQLFNQKKNGIKIKIFFRIKT